MTNPQTAVTVVQNFTPREVIRIGEYDRSKYNVLIPGAFTTQVTPFLVPVAREYALDPDPDHGEVYVQEWARRDGQFVPKAMGVNALGLANLANVAGILEVPQASGRVDDGRDPGVCTYRSTMFMRLPDGQPVVRTRELTLELATLIEEIRDRIEKKGRENKYNGKPDPWSADKVEAEIRKETILAKKFFHRKCETGAKSRTLRVMLGIRSKYSPDEIRRPFVLAAVVPDVNQPEIRERMLDQATSATALLFGPSGASVDTPARQLTAGPSDRDVASSVEEGVTEASAPTPEELAELVARPDPGADDVVEGETREEDPAPTVPTALPGERLAKAEAAPAQPSWMSDEPAASTSTSPLEAFIQRIRAAAADPAAPKGAPTVHVLESLRNVLAPLGGPAVIAGMQLLFGDEAIEHPSAAQARAIVIEAGDDLEALRSSWRELVEKGVQA